VKALVSLPTFAVVLFLDIISKAVAVAVLSPAGIPRPVVGEWVRLALVYNPGAAFGFSLGPYSRGLFLALTAAALMVLAGMYRRTGADQLARALALSLVAAGAAGNGIDRVRSPLGVVDFLDLGVGLHRWPTFNVADMAVTGGAALLAWVLWQEDRHLAAQAAPAPAPAPAATATATSPSPPDLP
jgi:signal peptidase II